MPLVSFMYICPLPLSKESKGSFFTFYLVVKSTSKCYDTVTEKYYREAEMWQRDECTSCYCGNDRKPECTETYCPPVFCEAPIKIKQRCCPVCPDTIQQGKCNKSPIDRKEIKGAATFLH